MSMISRLRQIRTTSASWAIRSILSNHKEVIIITIDDEPETISESNLTVFTKLADADGVMSTYLEQVLTNLLRTKDDKKSYCESQAAIDS